MSKPLDYSKWDNIDDSSDDDAPPRERPARPAVHAAALQPGGAAGDEVPETCDYSETELLLMQEYEVERPERLNQQLARALDCMERDIEAESLDALATSEAVPLFTTVCIPGLRSVRSTSVLQTGASLQETRAARRCCVVVQLKRRPPRADREGKRRSAAFL